MLSKHGATDLYHGNHYDVITLPRGASEVAIHGACSHTLYGVQGQ